MRTSGPLLLWLGVLGLVVGLPATLSGQAAKRPESKHQEWFQFRGPNRDGVSSDTGLLKHWPPSGPPLAWKATGIGPGYSAVSVLGDRVYTMGVLGEPKRTCVVALDAADGKIFWKSDIGELGDPNFRGGAVPRSTPATDGTFVFAICQGGELVCVQARSGKLVWKKAMDADLGSEVPGYGWSESPLVDGNQVVVTSGSAKATVVALNKADGAPIWEAKAKGHVEYCSLAMAEVGGVRQYVVYNNVGVAGIAAANGSLLWSASWRADTPGATPVCKDGIVLVSFHNGGSDAAFRVAGAGGRFQAEELYKTQEFTNHHGGMVAVGNHVYGTSDAALICLELRTGKVVWRDRCVGKGSVIAADGHLIIRSEGGAVALVEATPAGFREKGRFDVKRSGGDAAWANPVVSGGKLYLRDWDNLYCYDLRDR